MPSPALMTGTVLTAAASRAEPWPGWRSTIASAYVATVRIVSWSVSPLTTLLAVVLICKTSPPRRFMADSNDADVRVDGS